MKKNLFIFVFLSISVHLMGSQQQNINEVPLSSHRTPATPRFNNQQAMQPLGFRPQYLQQPEVATTVPEALIRRIMPLRFYQPRRQAQALQTHTEEEPTLQFPVKKRVQEYDLTQQSHLENSIVFESPRRLEQALQEGANPNFPLIPTAASQSLTYPLHIALSKRDPESVRLLLEYGASPFQRTSDNNFTPLELNEFFVKHPAPVRSYLLPQDIIAYDPMSRPRVFNANQDNKQIKKLLVCYIIDHFLQSSQKFREKQGRIIKYQMSKQK